MRRGIVVFCRLVTRHVVISLTALGLAFLGLGVFGVLPAMAAATAVSGEPVETPIPRLARTMLGVWRREIVRVNAVGLPLLAMALAFGWCQRFAGAPALQAPLLALAFAGLAGAVTAAALAPHAGGGITGLWWALGRLWLERPWLPPLLLVAWILAALSPFVHPLLGLYAAASLAASVSNRLVSRVSAFHSPLGQGVSA